MIFIPTSIKNAWLIDAEFKRDARGRFMRAWCTKEFLDHGINFNPVQANMGFSVQKGTIRGMHFQEAPSEEAKLVRCTRGVMYDVVVDLRPDSPSYGKWFGVELSSENARMVYVPELCAHGYQTLTDDTEMFYMASGFYAPHSASGVRYDDPAFGIDWPLPVTMISDQDCSWPLVVKSQR